MAPPLEEDKKMFDRLIESEPAGADFKNRRNYFMVSTAIVGILFLTAVVISIYASDYSLGSGSFELEALVAPVEMAAPAPEPPKQQTLASAPSASRSDLPMRTDNMARTDEPIVPKGISTAQNTTMVRPLSNFVLGPRNENPSGSGRNTNGTGPVATTGLVAGTPKVIEKDPIGDPPDIKEPPKKQPIRSIGVVNSIAKYLPKPPYPPAAIALNVQGSVTVQVLIDESGRVISANASNGHPLLRNAAEQAARTARFSPTYLSKVPVKVTGVIVYNFNRN